MQPSLKTGGAVTSCVPWYGMPPNFSELRVTVPAIESNSEDGRIIKYDNVQDA